MKTILYTFLALSAPLLAEEAIPFEFEEAIPFEFEGDYLLKGYDPYAKTNYTGIVTIVKKENGVYQGVWSQGSKKFFGTGMKSGPNSISFCNIGPASKEGQMQVGITVYHVKDHETLEGRWAIWGHTEKGGTETLLKK